MTRLTLAVMILALSFSTNVQADLVDRIMNPSNNGLPAHSFYHIYRFWLNGTWGAGPAGDQNAIARVNQLCNCMMSVTEQGQAATIRTFITSDATKKAERLADFEGAMILLQEGTLTETEFRNYYGLPR